MKNPPLIINLDSAIRSLIPFDTPTLRATQGERLPNESPPTPFVLSALRSKVYRSMYGVAAAAIKLIILFVVLWQPCSADAAKNILVFGDSLSAGYGVAAEKSWVHLMQQELEHTHPGFEIVNASISGETAFGGLQRIGKTLQQHRPAIVIVELGANDGLRGYKTEDIETNLGEIVKQAKRSRAKVLLIGMKLPPNYGKPYITEFENIYSRLAAKHHVGLLPFLLEGVEPEQFQADNLHPTAQGQPRIMQNVMQKLEPLLN